MEVSESETRQELEANALDFLKAVAIEAKTKLGSDLEWSRTSYWLVPIGSGRGCHGQTSTRIIINRSNINIVYRKMMKTGFPEKKRLSDALFRYGISIEEEQNSYFFHPLFNQWLNSLDPFSFDGPNISKLMKEFVDAVLEKKVIVRTRIAIDWLDIPGLPITLEKGITIRKITKEELWELGDEDTLQSRKDLQMESQAYFIPCETWKILDIELKYDMNDKDIFRPAYAIFNKILALLRLGSPGELRFFDLGTRTNFGAHSLGTNFAFSAPIPREIGKNEDVYFINSDMIGQLQCQWIQICRIMDSDNHYLRLPAQRLIDGGLRDRPEDAILDYAIGLERLLTGSARYELKFRFALTGATILSWYGGHKHLFFNKLKRFYDLRSAIIHGNEVDQADLKDMRSMGEDYLRKIWWWYLINGFTEARNGLTKGTDKIMDRILSDSTNGRPCRGIRHELETEN